MISYYINYFSIINAIDAPPKKNKMINKDEIIGIKIKL